MFCRQCYYDLRGQVVPRCPECSRDFSFDDPASWLEQIPTLSTYLSRFLNEIVWPATVFLIPLVLVLLTIASYFALPNLEDCRRYPTLGLTTDNLQAIMDEWKRQCGGGSINCRFDPNLARASMGRRISPGFDREELSRKRILERKIAYKASDFWGPLFFSTLLGCTYRRVWKTAVWIGISGIILSVVVISSSERIAQWVHPGSHAFLDDFWLLEPPYCPEIDGASPRFVVIAIEKEMSMPKARLVAMGDGLVTRIHDGDLGVFLSCPPPSSYDPRGRYPSTPRSQR